MKNVCSLSSSISLFLLWIVLFMISIMPTTIQACQVWNADGVDVSSDFVVTVKDDNGDESSYLMANCTGNGQCKDFRIDHCPQITCQGLEACTRVQITNVTQLVSCQGEHSCHRTQVLAFAPLGATDEAAATARVECIGAGACDVAVVQGELLDSVECLGYKACRKAHIRANSIKCTGGESKYTACDQVYFHARCLYCGVNGCGRNNCHVKLVGDNGNVMEGYDDDDNEADDDPMLYDKCQKEALMGECNEEWLSELNYEKEVEYGTEENENGDR